MVIGSDDEQEEQVQQEQSQHEECKPERVRSEQSEGEEEEEEEEEEEIPLTVAVPGRRVKDPKTQEDTEAGGLPSGQLDRASRRDMDKPGEPCQGVLRRCD